MQGQPASSEGKKRDKDINRILDARNDGQHRFRTAGAGPRTPWVQIVIYWSDEDALFIAEAPHLPGCFSHGQSYEEAAGNIQEAMALWLDVAREYGDPIPAPKSHALSA